LSLQSGKRAHPLVSLMELFTQKILPGNLVSWFSQRVVYHSAFWLFILLLLTLFDNTGQSFFFSISNEVINIFFYATLVYFNLWYLVPNYLTKKRFLTYCGLLILATLIITPLKVIVFYFKFSGLPQVQDDLLANMNGYFLINFFIAGSSTIVKIITDWARQLRERQELQTQTMQSELRFLKSQINPHFLFNTLNNLYALTLKKSDKAPDIVIKLSEMMRYMLYECNEKEVLLSKEVNYIRNYLDLERLRQGKNVEIRFNVEGNIGDQKIAPLMFTPFLENSFKHGLSHNISMGYVDIRLKKEDESIFFYIENSKPDTPMPKSDKRSGGIGLVNIHRRLNLLYPGNYDLKIEDKPQSYAVELQLNLSHHQKL
jgi:two-component system LytT family sensor kinase